MAHPPTRADDTTSGSLERRAETTSAPAALLPPEDLDTRKTAAWASSKTETEHRRHAAAAQPTLAPIDAVPDENTTALERQLTRALRELSVQYGWWLAAFRRYTTCAISNQQ